MGTQDQKPAAAENPTTRSICAIDRPNGGSSGRVRLSLVVAPTPPRPLTPSAPDGRGVSLSGNAGDGQQGRHRGRCHRGKSSAPFKELATLLTLLLGLQIIDWILGHFTTQPKFRGKYHGAAYLQLGRNLKVVEGRYSLLNGQSEFALDPVQPSFVPIEPRRDPGELDMQA